MSLSKLEPDFWIELERSYIERIRHRKALFAEHGKLILDYLPGSEQACKELMEMSLIFLCVRYPQYFSISADQSTFHNEILHTSTSLNDGSNHPLHILLENIPEDFALMIRNPKDGLYYFQAGVICSALGWHLGMKIGRPLHEVHGNVPDYDSKMRFSMDRN
ncbi:MAG: Vacuolar protein sorting-associated protein 17 [Watsoniomyces obsoletus]|nr:MAG: Vacuolar protein sorting-associated protein 17 [Watsoniomyces obsoletus]